MVQGVGGEAGLKDRDRPFVTLSLERTHGDLVYRLQELRRRVTSDGVHQGRIAIRRLQALLLVLSPQLSKKSTRSYRHLLKRLMHELGACREAEVVHQGLLELTAGTKGARRAALEPLCARCAHRHLVSSKELQRSLRELLGAANSIPRPAAKWLSAGSSTNTRVSASLEDMRSRLFRRMKKKHRRTRTLHRLRRHVKMLRYAQQDLEPVVPVDPQEVMALKGLQDCLGKLQDLKEVRHSLEFSAGEEGPLKKVYSQLTERRKHLLREFRKRRVTLIGMWERGSIAKH